MYLSFEYKVLRQKKQGLGAFSQAWTTDSPFIDTDESSGMALELDALKITSAPTVDDGFGLGGHWTTSTEQQLFFITTSENLSSLSLLTYIICATIGSNASLLRAKRQELGTFAPARTTITPFVDTNLAAGINLDLDRLRLTSAPAQDNLFNSFVLPMTTPILVALGGPPPVSTTTMRPMTPFPGYLVGCRICSISRHPTRHISARNGTVLGGTL
ncbi:hypothetical protein BV898_12411 [Hypsibius exemplaris]|uniref:Uncharacterized protein n=1 Tax=Hypsibius exemplaris TaxID=2072580 RepID=A0A1W0WDV9_HYPEX|nr:hypothetical protein BV898_12411 [Hypsibius exemplaris]